MKTLLKTLLLAVLMVGSVQAQDASSKINELYNKYGNIPNYKVNVVYEAINDNMGFKNVQEGVLVVEGAKYILKYGPNETWLNDGKTEYVGTKEPDHSQILFFCPGQNTEAIVDFGSMMTFFGSGHSGTMEGSVLKLKPSSEAAYKEVHVAFSGNNITSITAVDDFGTSHKYSFSNFSTNTSGTSFSINPAEYYEKIDERRGCK
ncbi:MULTISPECIES: LolA family protein [Roseivirga]|uniref:Outer membrane lipoprotein carrier protein LolA n=1 Tax=Roseivirga thermotolerans TaxID=1758176 RepID=A0ABQ3IF25_9BACT|nr:MULTISPECIES: hypothetical protein [Roseivirga]GHE75291.1 hypothetical protein GCM10011340_35150 [Roseivirga thermotolerans]|tara:strand:+ start:5239 stop:5850 length:612 start_codon:yes stop_codon:yes gene_type:complete